MAGNKARHAPANLILLGIPKSLVDLGGRFPQMTQGFHTNLVRPAAALTMPHPSSTLKPRSQRDRQMAGGGPEGSGGPRPQAQPKWMMGGSVVPLNRKEKHQGWQPLDPRVSHLHCTTSLPASPFPVSLCWAGTTLNPAALLGAKGPTGPQWKKHGAGTSGPNSGSACMLSGHTILGAT